MFNQVHTDNIVIDYKKKLLLLCDYIKTEDKSKLEEYYNLQKYLFKQLIAPIFDPSKPNNFFQQHDKSLYDTCASFMEYTNDPKKMTIGEMYAFIEMMDNRAKEMKKKSNNFNNEQTSNPEQ